MQRKDELLSDKKRLARWALGDQETRERENGGAFKRMGKEWKAKCGGGRLIGEKNGNAIMNKENTIEKDPLSGNTFILLVTPVQDLFSIYRRSTKHLSWEHWHFIRPVFTKRRKTTKDEILSIWSWKGLHGIILFRCLDCPMDHERLAGNGLQWLLLGLREWVRVLEWLKEFDGRDRSDMECDHHETAASHCSAAPDSHGMDLNIIWLLQLHCASETKEVFIWD